MVDFSQKVSLRREDVLSRLKQNLHDKNLVEIARELQIPIWFGEKKNKGWVGQTIEKLAGININSNPHRDGEDFELKTTELILKGGILIPKETLKITQLSPENILVQSFENSQLWQKLERLILVGYFCQDPDRVVAKKILSVTLTDTPWAKDLRQFWEDVQDLICSGEMKSAINLGSSADLIQLRPLGDGKQMSRCPVTGEFFPARAFYATKNLINLLMHEVAVEVSQY